MKVGKEEIIGMLAAIEYWSHADLDALNKEWKSRVERIAKLVETVPGVTTNITIPEEGNSYPTLTVLWDEKAFGLTVAQCDQQLRAGEPRIEVLTNSNPSLVPAVHEGYDPKAKHEPRPNQLQIISMTLRSGEDLIVGNRLRQILVDARKMRRQNCMDYVKRYALTLIALFAPLLHAGERKIDPTFLYRNTATVKEKNSDMTTATCHYKPLFGQGDSDTSVVVGVARYGQAIIDPKGECASVQYPDEDQVYLVLNGSASVQYGKDTVSEAEDYLYIPSTIPHAASNPSTKALTVLVMGYRTKGYEPAPTAGSSLTRQHRRCAHEFCEWSPIFVSLSLADGRCG